MRAMLKMIAVPQGWRENPKVVTPNGEIDEYISFWYEATWEVCHVPGTHIQAMADNLPGIIKVHCLLLLIHVRRSDIVIKDHQHSSGDFEVQVSKQRPEGMFRVWRSLSSESSPSEEKIGFLTNPMKSRVIIIALFAKFRPCNLNREKNMPRRCNRKCFPVLMTCWWAYCRTKGVHWTKIKWEIQW